MDKVSFGRYVASRRIDAGYTQQDLAVILSVNTNSISNIEKGVHYPKADKLFKLIEVLNLSIDTLMFHKSALSSSVLPDSLNEKIQQLNDDDRSFVFRQLEDLTDHLLK